MGLQGLPTPRCGVWGAQGCCCGCGQVLCSAFIVSFCLYTLPSPETSGHCCLPFLFSGMSILFGEAEAVEVVIPPCPCSCVLPRPPHVSCPLLSTSCCLSVRAQVPVLAVEQAAMGRCGCSPAVLVIKGCVVMGRAEGKLGPVGLLEPLTQFPGVKGLAWGREQLRKVLGSEGP